MNSANDLVTTLQHQLLEVVKQGQDKIVEAVHSWAEAVEPLLADMPALPLLDQLPKPSEVIETSFDFMEKLAARSSSELMEKILANQREFAERLLDALKVEQAKPGPESKPAAVSMGANLEAKAS